MAWSLPAGVALYRENPGPPERPEREPWGGPGRPLLLAFLALLLMTLLQRFAGPVVTGVVWGVGLVVFLLVRRFR